MTRSTWSPSRLILSAPLQPPVVFVQGFTVSTFKMSAVANAHRRNMEAGIVAGLNQSPFPMKIAYTPRLNFARWLTVWVPELADTYRPSILKYLLT